MFGKFVSPPSRVYQEIGRWECLTIFGFRQVMLYTLFYVVVKYNIQILNEMVYVKTLLIFKGIQHLAVKNEIMLPETIY